MEAISQMMTERCRFIDSGGAAYEGRNLVTNAWRDYLAMVPDYTIKIERTFVEGAEVVILGTAQGTYCREGKLSPEDVWSTPAAWFARVDNGLIQEWQVYADNEPLRARMRRISSGG